MKPAPFKPQEAISFLEWGFLGKSNVGSFRSLVLRIETLVPFSFTGDYQLRVTVVESLVGRGLPPLSEWIRTSAELMLSSHLIPGFVESIEGPTETLAGSLYQVVLNSPWRWLAFKRTPRMHSHIHLSTLLREILGVYPLRHKVRWSLKHLERLPPFTRTVQHPRTDWDYFQHLLATYGLKVRLQSEKGRWFFEITDEASALEGATPLSVEWEGAQAVRTVQAERVVLQRIRAEPLKQPEVALYRNQTDVQGLGTLVRTVGSSDPKALFEYRARVWGESLDAQREWVMGLLPWTLAYPGQWLTLKDDIYQIYQVRLDLDERSLPSLSNSQPTLRYSTRVWAVLASRPYRLPVPNDLVSEVGFLRATVTQEVLDEQGAYGLVYEWGDGESAVREAEHRLERLRWAGGPGYGAHFPDGAGATVLVHPVQGISEELVIVGSLFPEDSRLAVLGEHGFRTAHQNELSIVEKTSGAQLELKSGHREATRVTLAATKAHGWIEEAASEWILHSQERNWTGVIGGDYEVHMDSTSQVYGGRLHWHIQGDAAFQSDCFQVKAREGVYRMGDWRVAAESLGARMTQTTDWRTEGKASWISNHWQMDIAEDWVMGSEESLFIKANGASIELKASGEMNIRSPVRILFGGHVQTLQIQKQLRLP